MSRRVVIQPDGQFAIFSTCVDNFVIINMNKRQAYRECRKYWGIADSSNMIESAIKKKDSAYADCICTIGRIHGKSEVKRVEKLIKDN